MFSINLLSVNYTNQTYLVNCLGALETLIAHNLIKTHFGCSKWEVSRHTKEDTTYHILMTISV